MAVWRGVVVNVIFFFQEVNKEKTKNGGYCSVYLPTTHHTTGFALFLAFLSFFCVPWLSFWDNNNNRMQWSLVMLWWSLILFLSISLIHIFNLYEQLLHEQFMKNAWNSGRLGILHAFVFFSANYYNWLWMINTYASTCTFFICVIMTYETRGTFQKAYVCFFTLCTHFRLRNTLRIICDLINVHLFMNRAHMKRFVCVCKQNLRRQRFDRVIFLN